MKNNIQKVVEDCMIMVRIYCSWFRSEYPRTTGDSAFKSNNFEIGKEIKPRA